MTGPDERNVRITQGEFALAEDANTFISTILGSCVSVCLWDPVAGVGGMNHILNASSKHGGQLNDLAGINAMELLLNGINKIGGNRGRLKAKVFGGARMVSGLSDIGELNGKFALRFLQVEGIECLGQSLGGVHARYLKFWPAQGKVLQKIAVTEAVQDIEIATPTEDGNGLELF